MTPIPFKHPLTPEVLQHYEAPRKRQLRELARWLGVAALLVQAVACVGFAIGFFTGV